MRIGLTCATIEPSLTQGKIDGIGVHTKNLYDEFLKLNHQVVPYAFPRPKAGFTASSLPNGKLLPLPFNYSTVLSLSDPASKIIYRHLKKDIDVLHVTDHLIPRVRNIPVIATLHDALIFSHPEWYYTNFNGIKNWFRKQSMQWATHFITISQAMVPELVKFAGIPEDKISVVYNGISPFWFEKISPEQRKTILAKFHLPEKFLLFTATLQPKKNAARVIQAFFDLPAEIRHEYPLVIVGKKGWDAEESLSAISRLTGEKAGFWLQYVTNEELRALYQSASLYLCPSLHEGFGYTLLEAMASETPVITSNISALPEIAGDAAYLVCPRDTAGIKAAMQEILTNSTLRASLIQKGIHRAAEFTIEKCAKETLKVYEKIA